MKSPVHPAGEQAVNKVIHSLFTALFGEPFVKNKAFQFSTMFTQSISFFGRTVESTGGLKKPPEARPR
jgi:hypothetical protein